MHQSNKKGEIDTNQSLVARSSDISVPQILDSSELFRVDTPGIYLTNCSIEPDSSVLTAHFNSPQTIVNEYVHPFVQHLGTLHYAGKTLSHNPKILNYGTGISAHSEELHKNRMEPKSIDSGLYEAVLKHYLTECVSKVLPKITDGRYISDNKSLPIGVENKDFPGLFLAFSEKPIDELVENEIISRYFNSATERYADISMISDYLKKIEGMDGICLVTKDDSGVEVALNSSLLNTKDVDDIESYFPYNLKGIGTKTKAALYAATLLDEPMNIALIKQSTCNNLGVGKMIVLNAQGVERDVCIEYSPDNANKDAALKNGYHPSPKDLLVVEKSFVRNGQNKLVEEKTTKTPLSAYFESFNYAMPEVREYANYVFDNELIGTGY